MSAGREFHVCDAATENARRASSVCTRGTVSSGPIVNQYQGFLQLGFGSVSKHLLYWYWSAHVAVQEENRSS